MDTARLWFLHVIQKADLPCYVDWACDQLCAGADSRSLRILAGLDPVKDSKTIRSYFEKAVSELGLDHLPDPADDLDLARSVWKSYDHGEITANQAINDLANLHLNGESDQFIIWCRIEAELRDEIGDGSQYPRGLLTDLDATFRREWELFLRAEKLDLPGDYVKFKQCMKCGHIGESLYLETFLKVLGVEMFQHRHAYCKNCGSGELLKFTDPGIREIYISRLENEQSAAKDNRIQGD